MEQTYQESLALRKNGISGLSCSQYSYQTHCRLTFKENEEQFRDLNPNKVFENRLIQYREANK